jgi:LuxR family maltose regulon positive regulatory protein
MERGPSVAAPPIAPRFVLVTTKLHVPELRPGLVPRRELLARLAAGADRKLTLVCAPAGWGKSLLLGEWHASEAERRSFAWVSLDPSDDDPVRFWSYVIGGVRTVEPDFGNAALATLPTAGPALLEAVLPTLINELAGLRRPLVLVLDDYHVLHDELIHASVAFLLRHLPRTVHVAIASRADPPLSLARLRAAGEVVEVRADELRFSQEEADALLNGVLALDLVDADVALLRERTEGWPAGLQLAALSLRDRVDRTAFVHAFAGDDRHIGEYLHEVLAGEARPLREFLLRTSILERLCAPVCDAVTGESNAVVLLAEAHRSNLFLVALDDRAYWFRYHHLFRDLLRQELVRSEPELVAELHRRAFGWHDANGDVDDAIFHATAAGEIDNARELIARHWRPAWQVSPRTVARWLEAVSPEAVRLDPRLCLVSAWTALPLGRIDEVEPWLRAAEQGQDAGPLPDGGSVQANAAMVRSALAYLLGDVGRAGDMARRAHALTDGETSPFRPAASHFVGLTRYFAGDPAGATEPLEHARRSLSSSDFGPTLLTGLGVLAAARADLGESEAAEGLVAEAERLIAESGLGDSPTATMANVARGKLLESRGDHAGADAAFARATELARRGGWPLDLALALILHSWVKRRRSDYAGARSLVREAHQLLARCPDPGMLSELLARSERAVQLTRARRAGPGQSTHQPELSERELAVLRLLATDLSQREIGSQLYVSFNTVKSHSRSLFRKLGVSRRGDAVARARELGLL